MVVGDRLWLFSQTPNGPTPVQSMLMANGHPPQAPPPLVHQQMRPLMPHQAMLAGSGRPPPYFNRPFMSAGHPPPRLPLSAYTRMQSHFPHPILARSMCPKDDGYLPYANKFGSHNDILIGSSAAHSTASNRSPSSGLADLERAFGKGCELMVNPSGSDRGSVGNEQHSSSMDGRDSPGSEIDCEE